jgi:hypothetical protein
MISTLSGSNCRKSGVKTLRRVQHSCENGNIWYIIDINSGESNWKSNEASALCGNATNFEEKSTLVENPCAMRQQYRQANRAAGEKRCITEMF